MYVGFCDNLSARLEPIMLLKLPIMLLRNAPFFPPIMPQLCSISHLNTAI